MAGYLHRDIKPDNFRVHDGKVRITDFGLLIEPDKQSASKFLGTPYYASLAAHEAKDQAFKDELQSLAFNIMYLIVGEGELWFNDNFSHAKKHNFCIIPFQDPRLLGI